MPSLPWLALSPSPCSFPYSIHVFWLHHHPGRAGTAALGGALFFLVSESFWRFTEVAEVYILQNCFLILLFLLLLNARPSTQLAQKRYYWLFAFLYGLSAGVHATMAFFLPAFLVFIGLTAPRMFRGREFAFLAFFFLTRICYVSLFTYPLPYGASF